MKKISINRLLEQGWTLEDIEDAINDEAQEEFEHKRREKNDDGRSSK